MRKEFGKESENRNPLINELKTIVLVCSHRSSSRANRRSANARRGKGVAKFCWAARSFSRVKKDMVVGRLALR